MVDFTSDFGRAVRGYIEQEYVIWLTTIDSKETPQPRPVWFIWQDDSFLIFSKPTAHKLKHIAAHAKVALHFNTDDTGDGRVIVFTGEAFLDHHCPPAHKIPAYLQKYESGILALEMTPESFSAEYSTAIRIRPAEVRGWE